MLNKIELIELRRWCIEQANDVCLYRGNNDHRTDIKVAKDTRDVAEILFEFVTGEEDADSKE